MDTSALLRLAGTGARAHRACRASAAGAWRFEARRPLAVEMRSERIAYDPVSEYAPDLQAQGSRFTTKAAMAILTRSGGGDRYDPDLGDTGDPVDVVQDAFGSAAPGRDALGEPTISSGSEGRGAEAWTPIIEWAINVGIPNLWPAAAWEGIRLAAKGARQLVSRLRDRNAKFLVSRGYAALLAIEYVLNEGAENGVLDVEAVEEPSLLGSRSLTEVNYVGSDPWIVFLLNEGRTRRYIVAVAPDGSVLGAMGIPVGELERVYLPQREV